jgi:hypothetical protein
MCYSERMSFMSLISSAIYTLMVGGLFIWIFKVIYEYFYGENQEKQIRKIHKVYKKENISKVELLDHQPKKYSLYRIKTANETKKIKMKPGYKIVKLVKKKEPAQ